MQGQFKIVSEVLIFGIGILIASFVLFNFTFVKNFVTDVAKSEQYDSVSNVIRTSMLKSMLANSSVRVFIPPQIAQDSYTIGFGGRCDKRECFIEIVDLPTGENVQKEIFNINQSYNIIGSVASTGRDFEVVFNSTHIKLKRFQ